MQYPEGNPQLLTGNHAYAGPTARKHNALILKMIREALHESSDTSQHYIDTTPTRACDEHRRLRTFEDLELHTNAVRFLQHANDRLADIIDTQSEIIQQLSDRRRIA